jgi:predicted phosphodiesterase
MSIRKAQIGLPTGDLKELNERIENEVQYKIKERLNKIPQTLDERADVYLGHGDITHPQHAGVEERYLSKLLDGKAREGKFYMGGHEHGETTNKLNEMFYLNPGASRDSYAHAAVYVDDSNKFLAQKRSAITPDQKTDLVYRQKGEIASQSVQRGAGE